MVDIRADIMTTLVGLLASTVPLYR